MLITNFGSTPSQGGLMLPDWSYGKKITIPANSIDADLTNFPCQVILNSSNFDFSKCKADGSDIRFTDKLFNHYKFEKVEYSNANQFAKFNVLLPTVSDLTDTAFYMWYGNPNAYNTSIEAWQDQTGKQLTYNGNVKMAYNSTYGRRVASFDGSGDYFDISSVLQDNILTVEFLGDIDFTKAHKVLFDCASHYRLCVVPSANSTPQGSVTVYVGNGTSWTANFTSSTNLQSGFHNITVVSTGAGTYLYFNGVQVGSVGSSPVITSNTPIRLGNGLYSGSTEYLYGYLGGCRITRRARYSYNYTPPTKFDIDGSDVVFCTNFDTIYSQDYAMVQHMGDTLVDATGNGNNGTATGTTVVSTTLGKVRQFDGTDDKIVTPLFTNTDNVTLTVMAIKVGTGGTDLLFYVGTSGTNGYGLYTNSLKFSLKATSTFADTTVSNSTTPQVVTLTRTNGTWSAMIDGISYAVTNLAVTTPTGSTYFGGSTTDYYDGQLSNARYATVARSQAYTKAEQKAIKNTLLTISGA